MGGLTWLAVDASGIHATVTGVILGLLTPTRRWVSDERLRAILDRVVAYPAGDHWGGDTEDRKALRLAEVAARETLSPVERLEIMLHPWVGFVVMPLFAFANCPSLHRLRGHELGLVRRLHRYDGRVRLPPAVHQRIGAFRLAGCGPRGRTSPGGQPVDLPVPVQMASTRAGGLQITQMIGFASMLDAYKVAEAAFDPDAYYAEHGDHGPEPRHDTLLRELFAARPTHPVELAEQLRWLLDELAEAFGPELPGLGFFDELNELNERAVLHHIANQLEAMAQPPA